MPSVTFVPADGAARTVAVGSGASVMQAAVSIGVAGIDADCGGAASCATCHVHVDEAWLYRRPPLGDDENDMLDCAASERRPSSRPSCQIELSPELDGLIVRLPGPQS